MDELKPGKDGGSCAVLDGFGEDAVAVVVVDNNQIIVASAGWSRKAACLIAVDLTSRLKEGSIAKVGAVVGSGTGRKEIVVGWAEGGSWLGIRAVVRQEVAWWAVWWSAGSGGFDPGGL